MSPAEFLKVPTPRSWLATAIQEEELLLVDHAHCERKAASSALSLIHRHAERRNICSHLSRIVREEMRHFEQVLDLIKSRGFEFRPLTSGRYARVLHSYIRGIPGDSKVDPFLVAAIIEARSCERFGCLVEIIEERVASLYARLCDSEARHFLSYLEMAHTIGDEQNIRMRLSRLLSEESRLITEADVLFRFHSGAPSIEKH